ncbi:MAG: hypothetical protein ACRDSG_07490 [Pseudonocardiaceae bacterium]
MDEGMALMAVQGGVEDSALMKHVVRVDWFRRDPGGSTIFIMPAGGDNAAAQPVAEHGDGAKATHG